MFKKKSPDPGKERVSAEEMLAAQMELDELRKKYGIEAPEKKEGKISRMISSFFERRDNREKVCVNRKKFMLLMFFTGAFGGHRFYAKQYGLGVLYLLTCWTGFSLAMTVIDVLEFIPFPVDENGNIYV